MTNTQPSNIVDQSIPSHTAFGFSFERIFEDQIIIFAIKDSSRDTIDHWIDTINQLVDAWPADKLVFALQDFSQRKVGPTPYSRARAKEVTSKMTALKGYVAMVLPSTLVGHLIRIFYRGSSNFNTQRGKMQAKVFTDRSQAVDWLKEMVQLEANRTLEPVASVSTTK